MWKPLGSLAPSQLSSARLLLHWACQLVAAPATSWAEAEPDFSHTNLGWEPQLERLTGRAVDSSGLRAGLSVASMKLCLLRGDDLLAELALEGQTLDSATRWLAEAFASTAYESSVQLQLPTHDMPEHPVGRGESFSLAEAGAELAELEIWAANASQLLAALPRKHPEAGEVRLWPHHLDFATLLTVEAHEDPDKARSINFGVGFGDGSYAQPYAYVSPWPYPEPRRSDQRLSLGHWHTENFYAAILTGDELISGGAIGQAQRASTFLAEAHQACRRMMGLSSTPVRSPQLRWYKAAESAELPEGRVKSVSAGHEGICLTHHRGCFAALTNACPHQGGPLGEGSIEKGLLRCPWHGWDFDPLTGQSPDGHDDGLETYAVEVRQDGVYVGIEQEAPHTRTASDVMAETMVNWGIKWVFGMVGHSNLGLADAIRRRVEEGQMRYVGIRHEGAASFAASAYGKLTGRPAACLSIAGPGATNLLTGLWDAHVDRSPTLALTGQVKSQYLGRGAFQEVDLKEAFGGVAEFSASVLHDSDFAELMTLACKNALLRRGVSHLIFPDEVQMLEGGDAVAGAPHGRMPNLATAPAQSSLDEALSKLREAKRPVIIVGHGARAAMPAITEFAETLGLPVLTTFKGKSLISDAHPLGCGVLGRSGTPVASWFMNESDLLLVLGSSFSNHTGITDYQPIIQVDFEPMALARRHAVTVPVLGDIGVTVDLLRKGLEGTTNYEDQRSQVAARWQIWRDEKDSRADDKADSGLNSAMIFEALGRCAPEDAIIAVDVGNNTYSFGRYFESRRHDILMSGYLGSIGFGLPAAMGAWVATQEDDPRFKGRKVISVSGDGGLGQYIGELTTLAKYDMSITHVLLNNGQLGKISKEQRGGGWDVWETELHNPNFAQLANNCGVLGIRVREAGELEAALEQALSHEGPALVEIMADAAAI
jgi:thiamine pyrophosphate-dependent acetolactate synthase large subunit-like protein/nitrite reductase/ring-hydroxylating ferredoxin subunit